MRPHATPRSARVVAVAVVAFVASSLVDAPVAAQPEQWIPPVAGAVVRPFAAPIAEYAAGHRGVDFAASVGAPVHASNDGTVSFAGTVAGALHVVVAHDGGIRTSYSFLSAIDVRAGQQVSRGQVVGRAGGVGDGHGPGVLHFGVRVGDRYVDPMLLFRPRDLTQMVRLVPPEELEAAERPDRERDVQHLARVVQDEGGGGDDRDCSGVVGDVADVIGLGGAVEDACDTLEAAVDTAWRLLDSLGDEAERFVDALDGVVSAVIDEMRRTGDSLTAAAEAVAAGVAQTVEAVIEAAVRYARNVYEELTSCPQPEAKRRVQGSGNHAFAVGGFDSKRTTKADGTVTASFHFQAKRLGYGRREVEYMSYSATSAAYDKRATHESIVASARLLAEQLRAYAREHPTRPLDLVGHSQGGVVIYVFLAAFYIGHEHEYPRIENVLTFASPLEGTPTADLATDVHANRGARTIAEWLSDYPLAAKALAELRQDSAVIANMRDAEFPRDIRYASIVGSEDLAVPSPSCDPPVDDDIGEKIVVPAGQPWWPDDHDAVLSDDDTLSAAQTFLSGGSASSSCGPLVDATAHVETAIVTGGARFLAATGGPTARRPETPVPPTPSVEDP